MEQSRFESNAARSAAAVIQSENNVSVLGEILTEEPLVAARISAPGFPHPLITGATVHVDNHWVPPTRLQVARFDDVIVQCLPVLRRQRAKFRRQVIGEIRRVRMITRDLVGNEIGQYGSRYGA